MEIGAVESQLTRIHDQSGALDARSGSAQTERNLSMEDQKLNLDRQLADIGRSLHETEARIQALKESAATTPPDITLPNLLDQRASLQSQVDQLSVQKQQLDVAHQSTIAQLNQAASAQRDQLRKDEETLRARLSELEKERDALQAEDSAEE